MTRSNEVPARTPALSGTFPLRAVALLRSIVRCATALGLVAACQPQPVQSLVEAAEFGVLFGGQVQERDQIPFVLDSTKQTLGFSILLRKPTSTPLSVRWELSKPGTGPRQGLPSDPLSRRTELFERAVAPDQIRFNETVTFEPGDSLGLWNIRVLVGDHVAIDRPFMVYDPITRKRRLAAQQQLDGGL